jgi:gamma-glutamyltranspeptidase/glutathione hydrolase
MSEFTTRPEIRGTFGVVSSTHWLASQAAMGILERGGNAFDAAVAGGFVLQVVEPHLNGPGGEVPIMLWSEREQRMRVVCGQGTAPALADAAAFRRQGLELVPGIGLMPATVPGAFGAWLAMLRDYGSMELGDVLRPAIDYAHNGFPLVPRIVQAIVAVQGLFRNEWATSAQVWLPDGKVPGTDQLFRNPALAATYRRIASESAGKGSDRAARINHALRLWYRGFVAQAIDDYYRNEAVMDCTGERNRGLLRLDDMADWKAGYEDPLTLDFGSLTVAKCGPWSQGPVFLQQLSMLRALQIQNIPYGSERWMHLAVEVTKLAMADRLAWYGDPDFVDVPVATLLSDTYARERIALINEQASADLRPGSPEGRVPRLPDLLAAQRVLAHSDTRFGIGEPTFADLPPVQTWAEKEIFVGDTCHIDVIDKQGNMVSATPSGGWLSSSPVVPGLGFSLNTRLQMTWTDPAVPGCVQAGKRPNTTLSPGMVLRDGRPYMAFGTPGGDQQDQWTVSFLLRHCLAGMNLQEAIDAPSWHAEHYPASFWPRATKLNRLVLEQRLDESLVHDLRARGHDVVVGGPWSEGRISACTREETGAGGLLLRAAANPRGMQGYAVGR